MTFMSKLKQAALLAALAFAVLPAPARAAIVDNLGINPTSATGHFDNAPIVGAFDDQYTFQLIGAPQFFTVASATNVYPDPRDFIVNFSGQIFQQVGVVGGGDDIPVTPVVSASPNCFVAECQGFGGSGLLPAGNYYLNITGINLGTAGYGGDLATVPVPTAAVPEASTWAMMLLGFAGVAVMGARRRKANGGSFRFTSAAA
jgi:hypothetical protein